MAMFVDKVFISWIGPTSFGVERNGVTRAFSLEVGQVVPPEFKKGDLVELYLEGDTEAEIWGIESSDGCYRFKHIPSGKEFKTWHRAEAWRFDPSPTPTVKSEEERLARLELKLLKEYLEKAQG